MLIGIDPVLTGELLCHIDAMGHSDSVVVADAHFPAARLGHRSVDVPLLEAPRVLRALRSVLPLDDAPAVDLMGTPQGDLLPVQLDLLAAAGVGPQEIRLLGRSEFYDVAAEAFLVIRTGETRTYGNAALRKGLVSTSTGGQQP